jgi:hypothetical protein
MLPSVNDLLHESFAIQSKFLSINAFRAPSRANERQKIGVVTSTDKCGVCSVAPMTPEVIKVDVIPLVGESAGVSLLVLPFLISLPIISRVLSREYGARQYSVAGLCAATFALSVDLLTLASYEVAGILSPTSRHTAWRIVLGSLVVSLAGVLPFFACLLLAADAGLRGWRVRIATATAGTMLWLWLFWRAGALFPISARGDHDLLSLEGAVGRLGVAGVTTAALLSGWGAVANPYAYLTVPAARGVTDADVRAARRGVKDAADRSKDAAHRLARAERRSNDATSAAAAAPKRESTSSWLGSLFGSDGSGDGITPEVLARRAEASIAADVAAEAVAEFRELSEARQRARGATTICGRSSAALGVILSIYCIYRVFMALANIVLHRDPTKDPVTRGLEVTLMAFEVPAATAAWFVQPASFLLVGVLAVGSIRGFLQSLARLASWGGARSGRGVVAGVGSSSSSSVVLDTISAATTTTTTAAATTASAGFESPDVDEKTSPREALYGALSLLVAQLLGMYALSTLLLMRMSVPEEYRAGITRAVGDIHFNFFHREC